MRLDKYLCDCLGMTRSEVKKIIGAGKVLVNDEPVKKADFQVNENNDTIIYNQIKVTYEKFVYFLINKPAGYVCANKDNLSPTVIDIFKGEGRKNLSCVGRLDKDTTGFLIVTDDGELNHKLTSPSKHVFKDYLVGLRDNISDEDINKLCDGLDIGDEDITLPARVEKVDEKTIILSIREGRYHQVKRMLLAVGNEVMTLHRLSLGNVSLDEDLKAGEYRRLTKEEIKELKEC